MLMDEESSERLYDELLPQFSRLFYGEIKDLVTISTSTVDEEGKRAVLHTKQLYISEVLKLLMLERKVSTKASIYAFVPYMIAGTTLSVAIHISNGNKVWSTVQGVVIVPLVGHVFCPFFRWFLATRTDYSVSLTTDTVDRVLLNLRMRSPELASTSSD
jgi:hypothetical protein